MRNHFKKCEWANFTRITLKSELPILTIEDAYSTKVKIILKHTTTDEISSLIYKLV